MKKIVVSIVMILILGSMFVVPSRAQVFQVINSIWGTSANPLEVGPGDRNVPLTLTLEYLPTQTTTATSISGSLTLPEGFTDINGDSTAVAHVVGVLSNSIFYLTYNLNIDLGVSVGTYAIPLEIVWDTTTTKHNTETVTANVQLKGKVKFNLETEQAYLMPGQLNNITILLTNQGSGSASEISVSISAPLQISVLNSIPTIAKLDASASINIGISVYVAPTAGGSPLSLALTCTYKDAYFNTRVFNQNLGFIVETVSQPDFSVSSSASSLVSGKENAVTISVKNKGNTVLGSVSASLNVPATMNLVGTDGEFSLGALNPGEEKSFSVTIFVASTTPTSSSVQLLFSWLDSSQITKSDTRSLGFIIKTSDMPFFTVSSSPSSLTSEEVNNVTITIKNSGSVAMNALFVSLTAQSPLSLTNTDGKFNLGTLNAGQSKVFSITVYAASFSSSSASLQLAFSYMDPAQINRNEIRTLTFLLSAKPTVTPISLNIEPTTLATGRVNNLTITISNIGGTPITSFSASFAVPASQITWLQPDLVQEAQLNPGESITVQARAYVPSLVTASAVLQISMKYYDSSNMLNQEARNMGLLTRGTVELGLVDLTRIPDQPTPGQIFSITVTMTNTGTITASAVKVTPRLIEGFAMFGSTSVFIGDVPINTPTTFTLSLQVVNTTNPGTYEIPVDLTYFDNLRSPLSVTMNLPIIVKEKTSSSSEPGTSSASRAGLFSLVLPILIALVTLVAGFFLGRRFAKK